MPAASAVRRGPWLVLLASFLVYAGTQMFGWNVTTHPSGEGWFFDPLAWQFVFVIGAAFGSGQMDRYKPLLFKRPVLITSALVAVVAAGMQFTNALHAMFPAFPTLFLIDVPIEKTVLEPARLISFFALVILAARWMPAAARMAREGETMEAHGEHQGCHDERAQQVTYPPALHAEPESL